MSRRNPSNQLNSSLGPSTMTNTSPTVITAIRKLKQESDLLLRENKRYRVLNHQISREHIRSINRSKQQTFFESVKQSAEYDKEVKREHERKNIEEVKKRFSTNLRHREQNKQMIHNVRRSFNHVNHELYEQIRQKRKDNEQMVNSRRSFVLQSRAMSRQKAEEEERNRRRSIQNFHDSRVQTFRRNKEEEIQQMLRKSQEKRRFCEAISSRNSRIRDTKLDLSRSVSNRSSRSNRSLRNPENNSIQAS